TGKWSSPCIGSQFFTRDIVIPSTNDHFMWSIVERVCSPVFKVHIAYHCTVSIDPEDALRACTARRIISSYNMYPLTSAGFLHHLVICTSYTKVVDIILQA